MLIIATALATTACSSTPKIEPTQTQSATVPTASAPPSVATEPVPAPPVVPAEAQQKFDAAMKLVNAGKQDEAALQLEQLANDYPTLTTPLINVGLLYLKANQFTAAEHAFERVLQRDVRSAVAANYLGVCYRNLGKFKEAEAAYQGAIVVTPTYAAAHLNLGVLYDLYLQQPAQALVEYERYQQLLSTPDTKVASWIKELNARLGNGKAKTSSSAAAGEEKHP